MGLGLGRRWILSGDPDGVDRLVRELSLHPLTARVLANRGFADPAAAERFLTASLADLPDPFLMLGMRAAVDRLIRAMDGGEAICCYGDYDVDGVTSTALLADFLKSAGAKVTTYTPHRLVEGYGLNQGAVTRLAGEGIKLIVTLDCGITSVEEVAAASRLGADTIVVDHHTVPVELPAASAILNPHQPGCGYPSKLLAAVGVTFCLVMALRRTLRERGTFGPQRPEPNLKECLDLVALGTIADVVPLLEVNRLLVRGGLEVLARGRRPGVRALKVVAGIEPNAAVSAGQVGFGLAPRINAAGRLDDAGRGVRLLLARESAQATALAEELDRENQSRREIERRMLDEALFDAGERVAAGARGLVLSRPDWHPGVVGIVASRVVERFHRPAVLVGLSDGVGKGSGRSIEGFHLYEALARCSDHLVRFGGHKHAAGVTVDPAALPAFCEAFERHAGETLRPEDLVPRCRLEGWLEEGHLDPRAATALERLAPFGAGNPEPLFALRSKPRGVRTVGEGGAHLKLRLGSAGVDAIGFGLGDRRDLCGDEVEAAVTLGFDEWGGNRRLQLRVKDLRAPQGPRPS
jgi:single-stranded-DNA-specific exonuclease